MSMRCSTGMVNLLFEVLSSYSWPFKIVKAVTVQAH